MLSKPLRLLRSAPGCIILLLATASLAQTTLNVGPGQPYSTIQSGINAAVNGDTVLVAPGTYYENINFNGKAITVTSLAGASTTILDGSSAGAAVSFKTGETSSSTISGFTIQHGGSFSHSGIPNFVGSIYLESTAPTILNNVITLSNCWGIASYYSAPLIQNNTISATQDPHGSCSFGGGSAILVWGGINSQYNQAGVQSHRLRLFLLLFALIPASLTLAGWGEIITPYDVPPSASPGTYIIPITATGAATGIAHTASLTLTVTP
jgi:parallel beta-helix repeat protein